MWYAFIQIQKLCQCFYKLRVIYDDASSQFHVNPKTSLYYNWTCLQGVLTWLVSFTRMMKFLSSRKGEHPELTVEVFILDIFYWSMVSLCLAAIWLTFFRPENSVWVLNQLMFLKSREGKFSKPKIRAPHKQIFYSKKVRIFSSRIGEQQAYTGNDLPVPVLECGDTGSIRVGRLPFPFRHTYQRAFENSASHGYHGRRLSGRNPFLNLLSYSWIHD